MDNSRGWPLTGGMFAKISVPAIPLLYLTATLVYSACMAPWGRQVDPESAYAMNGIVAAAGYGSMKFDHPGTTTTLMVEMIVRLWALIARPEDIVAFGLKHYDAIIYAARTCETVILFGALLAGGMIVARATRSAIAAMIFQVGPFVHVDTFHFEMVLIPESLMVSCAILGFALVIKATLDEKAPTIRLGILSGLIFALGFSSKFLYLVLAVLSVSLLRNRRAFVAAYVAAVIGFVAFNSIFNPDAILRGFGWMFSLATHKGSYGSGEPGFMDASAFLPNLTHLIVAAPLAFVIYATAAVVALAQINRTRNWSDPVSLTLLAGSSAYALQLVATSKQFSFHYMMASWVLIGGIAVLVGIQLRRLVPNLSPVVVASVATVMCATTIGQTLYETWQQAVDWVALDDVGARLSKAVALAAPACANVTAPFVRAPEDEISHGWLLVLDPWGTREEKSRFSESYSRTFPAPLLDHIAPMNFLTRNARPITYRQLASDHPCIVVRTPIPLKQDNALDLFQLDPEQCVVNGIFVSTVGIACAKVATAFENMRSAALK